MLAHADSWVDDGVFGNRPGRQASDLWFHLLSQIEAAYSAQVPLRGLSADIEKCFNCIPRFPALCLAVLVGTPDSVTTAWAGALASMKRHFKVRESYSDGFLTSTGLAEGCGLSVYGMLLVDHLFACWMRAQSPAIRTLSYVDDWQTYAWDSSYAVRQLQLVEQFAGHLDLTIDRRKTFGWSTDPVVRQHLRDSGITVLHHARELGGHMGISKQYTNRTLVNRFQDLDDFWPKLRASKARHHAKVYMLRAVACPRGLHAVASALWVTQNGMNSAGELLAPFLSTVPVSMDMSCWVWLKLLSIPSSLVCFGLVVKCVPTVPRSSGFTVLLLSHMDFWTCLPTL